MKTILEKFKDPEANDRGKPFWSWNGKLDKEELLRQIGVMKEMGMGGFFMHSRTGLETEYLGEEWFDLINACTDHGAEQGMEAWIYDEDRWPSGLAGGIVSENSEFRQKAIQLEVSSSAPEGDAGLGQWVAHLEGAKCSGLEVYTGEIPAGKVLLSFRVIEQGKSGFYNGYTYVDTMNKSATDAFLASTHEKYAEKCGDRLGTTIKGIFTDEPHRGALMDGFSMYMDKGEYTTPFTDLLFDEFESRFGYDLKERLPELFFQMDGQRLSKVKWHYVELLQQLFLENYALPCKEWCEEHGLVLTGHVLHEDNLTAQTAMSGSVMRYYEHMTSPGVDVLSEGNRNYWIVKQLTSAARQTGKKQLLSELYGCTGWQMPFSGHKAVGDWQALLGVNFRCHHLSWYTMRGEAKRDYPASILHQSAWHREYKSMEDYFSRFGMLMAEGKPVCHVLVLNPVETFWAQVHLGWSKNLALQDEHLKSLELHYQELFFMLMSAQIDFDYGDEDMLSRLGSVDGSLLSLGQCSYTHVVVSGMETIRSTTMDMLKDFSDQGGKVIVAGASPSHLDAEPSTMLPEVMSGFHHVPFQIDDIVSLLPEPEAMVTESEVFVQVRRSGSQLMVAALNINREQKSGPVEVKIRGKGTIELWDCTRGEVKRLDNVSYCDGWASFTSDFAEGESRIWMMDGDSSVADSFELIESEKTIPIQRVPLKGPFEFELDEPNICVLDEARYRIQDSALEAPMDILKIDQKVRDVLGVTHRGGEMLQPWFSAKSMDTDQREVKVDLEFSFQIETMPEWLDLVLEDSQDFVVHLNGEKVDLSDVSVWIDIGFHRVSLPVERLKDGDNRLQLSVSYHKNSNLEAIYLLGPFGVKINDFERILTTLPKILNLGDVTHQGLPFYSGVIRYQLNLPEGASSMEIPEFGGACLNLILSAGKSKKKTTLGWAPYRLLLEGERHAELEVVLTRRNTFGPLHDNVPDRTHNGPDHWLTEGEFFTREPQFVPSGLLRSPEVSCQ